MRQEHQQYLIELARSEISHPDPSHDFLHALRVFRVASFILSREGGDWDIVIPAALFHDLVIYPKNDPRSLTSATESALGAISLLNELSWFPQNKLVQVQAAIEKCSFSKNLSKETLEEYIVQDADLLESVGAIAIARSFGSGGQMDQAFYCPSDPGGVHRVLDPYRFTLDFFQTRLLKITSRLYTDTAKIMAVQRRRFTEQFYNEFLREISEGETFEYL